MPFILLFQLYEILSIFGSYKYDRIIYEWYP